MDKKQMRIKQVRRQICLLLAGAVVLFLLLFGLIWGNRTQEGKTVQFVEKKKTDAASADFYVINEECEEYRSQVKKLARRYNMQEYEDLIMAVMMQESGGKGLDVMQSSEGSFNERYSRVPGGITDTTYSIECGIQELRTALHRAGATGPRDIARIRQALQAYNFGTYYLDFSKERGVETWEEETVAAFAEMASGGVARSHSDAQIMGKWDYGDQMYPDHVLRYYKYNK